jgi:hypothetical protein
MVAAVGLVPCRPLAAQGYASSGRGYAELAVVRVSSLGDSTARRIRPGYGFDVAATIPAQSPLLVSVGFQYTSHPTTDAPAHLNALQFYLEPRFALLGSGPLIPYLSAHFGLVRWSQDIALIDDAGVDAVVNAVQSGSAIGVGAGVMVRATPRIRGYLSAGYQRISMGTIAADGAPVLNSATKTSNLVLRMGVSVELSETASQLRTLPRR